MRKLFGRLLKRGLFFLACLITLGLLAWQFENFRGRRAWRKHKAAALAKGEVLDIKGVIPPSVLDASNFASIPFFAPLYDFKPGTQQYKDENASERVKKYFDPMPGKGYETKSPPTSNTWVTGVVDLRMFVAEAKQKSTSPSGPPLAGTPKDESVMPPAITPAKAAEQTLAFIAQFDEALQQIEQAAKRPQSRFPVAYEHVPSIGVLLPHLAVLRNVSRAVSVRCAARLELGQTDAAAQDILLLWRLADAIEDEPILISYLVRVAILQFSLQAVADGMSRHAWSDAQLQTFQRELLSRNLFADLKKAIQGEIVFFGMATIDQVRRGVLKGDAIADAGFDAGPLRYMPDGWFYFEMINYHKMARVFADHVTEEKIIDPEAVAQTKSAFMKTVYGPVPKHVFNHSIFSSLLLPAMDRITTRTARGQTGLHLATLACALERHRIAQGSYPESLNQLAPLIGSPIPRDVIKGQPLHYRLEGANSYVLYSVGWDGNDDGGQISIKKANPDEDPNHDWVWRPIVRTNSNH